MNIFYVVDLADTSGQGQPDRSIGDPEVQKSYYYTDTGLIAQNVYLFAASQGLAAWFHNCDKENTAQGVQVAARTARALRAVRGLSNEGLAQPITRL